MPFSLKFIDCTAPKTHPIQCWVIYHFLWCYWLCSLMAAMLVIFKFQDVAMFWNASPERIIVRSCNRFKTCASAIFYPFSASGFYSINERCRVSHVESVKIFLTRLNLKRTCTVSCPVSISIRLKHIPNSSIFSRKRAGRLVNLIDIYLIS